MFLWTWNLGQSFNMWGFPWQWDSVCVHRSLKYVLPHWSQLGCTVPQQKNVASIQPSSFLCITLHCFPYIFHSDDNSLRGSKYNSFKNFFALALAFLWTGLSRDANLAKKSITGKSVGKRKLHYLLLDNIRCRWHSCHWFHCIPHLFEVLVLKASYRCCLCAICVSNFLLFTFFMSLVTYDLLSGYILISLVGKTNCTQKSI